MNIKHINFYDKVISIYADGLEFECPLEGNLLSVSSSAGTIMLIFDGPISVIFSKRKTVVQKAGKEYTLKRDKNTIERLTNWIKGVIDNA